MFFQVQGLFDLLENQYEDAIAWPHSFKGVLIINVHVCNSVASKLIDYRFLFKFTMLFV